MTTTSFLTSNCSLPRGYLSHPSHHYSGLSVVVVDKNESCDGYASGLRNRLPSVTSQTVFPTKTFFPESSSHKSAGPEDREQVNKSSSIPPLSTSGGYDNSSKSPSQIKSPSKSQLSSFKLFLKSPKQDKFKDDGKNCCKKILSPKSKKWYKQPFQKFANNNKRTPTDSTAEGNVFHNNNTNKALFR